MQQLTETGEKKEGCQVIQYVIDTAPLFNDNMNTNNKINWEGDEKERKKDVFVVCVSSILTCQKEKSLWAFIIIFIICVWHSRFASSSCDEPHRLVRHRVQQKIKLSCKKLTNWQYAHVCGHRKKNNEFNNDAMN